MPRAYTVASLADAWQIELGRHFPLSPFGPSLLRVSALRASIGAA